MDFLTQRYATQLATATGVGGFKTIDRMGNPAVNVALLPHDLKNTYNAGSAKQDVSLKFITVIA